MLGGFVCLFLNMSSVCPVSIFQVYRRFLIAPLLDQVVVFWWFFLWSLSSTLPPRNDSTLNSELSATKQKQRQQPQPKTKQTTKTQNQNKQKKENRNQLQVCRKKNPRWNGKDIQCWVALCHETAQRRTDWNKQFLLHEERWQMKRRKVWEWAHPPEML